MSNIKQEFGARINPVSINIETLEYLNQFVAENNITSVLAVSYTHLTLPTIAIV